MSTMQETDLFGLDLEAFKQKAQDGGAPRVISYSEAAEEAKDVFALWADAYESTFGSEREKNHALEQPALPTLPCRTNPDVYYPELGEPEEYDTPEDYIAAEIVFDASISAAYSLCRGDGDRPACPLLKQCLAYAVSNEAITRNRQGAFEPHGIWGGYGIGSRNRIGTRFEALRKRFLKNEDEEGYMTDEEYMTEFVPRAKAIKEASRALIGEPAA